MSWIEKNKPTRFDREPIEGLVFLDGDILARHLDQSWSKDHKLPMIQFPSGLRRPLWMIHETEQQAIVHLFGEMDLPINDSRDPAYEKAQRIAEACGYGVMKVGEDSLEIAGHTPEEYLQLTYNEEEAELADVIQLDPKEWQRPLHVAHRLMTDEIREQLPALYTNETIGLEAKAPVKYFTPDSNWTWYPSEFDGHDLMFGLVIGFEIELGLFSLKELQEVRGPLGLRIERDLHYEPKSLKELQDWHGKQRG